MLKQRLFKTTPFLLLYVFGLFGIVYQLIVEFAGPQSWGHMAVFAVLPFIVAMIIIDLLLKTFIKQSMKWIWIIESFLSLALVYYWIVR
jgi:hypothetical protein